AGQSDLGQLPRIEPDQAALPGLYFIAALAALSQVGAQVSFGRAGCFTEHIGDPIFRLWMIHKTKDSLGMLRGFRGGKGAGLPLSLGCRIRLSRTNASAMRELTVPSGISRISAIRQSFRFS